MRLLVSLAPLALVACGALHVDDATPTDVYAITQGGTRLRARFIETADLHAFDGWYDTMRMERCSFAVAEDGATRCLPIVDCSRQTDVYGCQKLPGCPERTRVTSLDGAVVAPEAFVAATPTTVRRGALHAVIYDAADGARAFGHFLTPEEDIDCTLATREPDSIIRCYPQVATYVSYFDVPGCAAERASFETACTEPAYAEKSDGFALLGAPHVVPNASEWISKYGQATCRAVGAKTLRSSGDTAPVEHFIAATPKTQRHGRLVQHRLDVGDGFSIDDRALSFGYGGPTAADWTDAASIYDDTTLGLACTFTETTAGLRCLPVAVSELDATMFADADCSVEVIEKDGFDWRYYEDGDGVIERVGEGVAYRGDVWIRDDEATCQRLAKENAPTELLRIEAVPLDTFVSASLALR